MTIEAIANILKRRPFVPVRLHLQDNAKVDIVHPEFVIVARDGLYVSEPIPETNVCTSPRIIGYENIVMANTLDDARNAA